jgi:hypothetical protein
VNALLRHLCPPLPRRADHQAPDRAAQMPETTPSKKRNACGVLRNLVLTGTLFLMIAKDHAFAQNGLTLIMWRLTHSGSYIQQVVSVKNDTVNLVRIARIECGFFRGDQLIATGTTHVQNLAPASTGLSEALARSDVAADRAQCRVASVR